MVLDDRKYVNDCYDLLMELEIIDSKYQNTEQILTQHKKNKKPSSD